MSDLVMFMRALYAAAAASLLVALGLGLIYLVVMDRVSAGAAIGLALAAAAAIPLVVLLREYTAEPVHPRREPRDPEKNRRE